MQNDARQTRRRFDTWLGAVEFPSRELDAGNPAVIYQGGTFVRTGPLGGTRHRWLPLRGSQRRPGWGG